jgi:hypothetical protein
VPRKTRPWWQTGYGKLAAAMGFIGLVFAFAQLPVKLAGFPQSVKESINVIEDAFSKSTTVTATRIGPFHVDRDRIRDAVSDFGPPDSREAKRNTCTLRWNQKGVEILFVSTTGSRCDPDLNFFCAATLTTHRWRTTKGLRVGDSLARLHALYPAAARATEPGFNQRWVLDAGTLPCRLAGENGLTEGLQATTIGDRVDRFGVYYFSVGE